MSKYFVVFFIVVFIGSVIGLGILSRQNNTAQDSLQTETSQESAENNAEVPDLTQQEAIDAAEAYSPPADTMCTMMMTPAMHDETGAEYTFPSGCIAPGWTAQQ